MTELLGISGTGVYLPKQIITVRELARKYRLGHGFLSSQGVKSVHVAGKGDTELEMAIKAAQAAILDAGLQPKEIDLIIYCKGISRQSNMRSISSHIIEEVKAPNAYGFDIEGGLIGGLIGLQLANDVIKNNTRFNHAVIVAAQEFEELYLLGGGAARLKNMIFGDGAAAAVLSRQGENNKILASEFVTDHYTSLIDDMLAETFKKESMIRRILTRAKLARKLDDRKMLGITEKIVDNTFKAVEDSVRSVNLDITDINHFIKTQISIRETDLLCERLGIAKEQMHNASAESGHLGTADILYNLHFTLKSHELKNLDVIALVTANYDCSSGAIVLRR